MRAEAMDVCPVFGDLRQRLVADPVALSLDLASWTWVKQEH